MKSKCVFLDRDGVINVERQTYTYRLEDFRIIDGVKEALHLLKEAGYLRVVITNQAGISKGEYGHEDVAMCHQYMQEQCDHLFDAIYYCPYYPTFSESLARKPDSLMLEKAIAKFDIDVSQSWMIGDKERDVVAGEKVGVKGILIQQGRQSTNVQEHAKDLLSAVKHIVLKK